jgi:hypothetical protein
MTRQSVVRGLIALLSCGSLLGAASMARAQDPPTPSPAARAGEGWVVLPVNEYRELRTKAFPRDRPPDPPPVDAAISGVDYELTVNGDSASGQARITIDVLKEGWVRIPMPQGLLIREARLDARPVALVDAAVAGGAIAGAAASGAAGGAAPQNSASDRSERTTTGANAGVTPSLLLSRPGRALLTLDIVVPITTRQGGEYLTLPASAAALVRAGLVVPRADVAISVGGGFIGEQTKDANATKVMVFGQGGAPLSLSWARTRENTRAQQPLRLRSTVTEVVGLGEDASQMTTRVQLEVVQGVCSSASLTLPTGFTINEVSGSLVSDWEVRGGSLVVSFLEPVIDRVNFVLVGEFRPPREGRIVVPLVQVAQVAQVERESGGVAVEVLGAGEITRHEARGLDPADPSDLGDALAGRDSPALVAFRYRAHDGQAARSLAVTVSRYTAQAVLLANVEEARYRVLLTEDGKALVEGRFAVRNNQRSFLGITLPTSATLWSASIDRRATRPGRAADGTVLIPLRKNRAGGDTPLSAVQIIYLDRQAAWNGNGQIKVAMPALDLPVSRTGVTLDYSPRFRLTLTPGAFRLDGETPMPPALAMLDAVGVGSMSGSGGGGGVGSGRGFGPGESEREPSPLAQVMAEEAQKRREDDRKSADDMRGLVDRFQKENRGARAPGVVPVRLTLPRVGSSLYLVSELTPERVAPEAIFNYKREDKR